MTDKAKGLSHNATQRDIYLLRYKEAVCAKIDAESSTLDLSKGILDPHMLQILSGLVALNMELEDFNSLELTTSEVGLTGFERSMRIELPTMNMRAVPSERKTAGQATVNYWGGEHTRRLTLWLSSIENLAKAYGAAPVTKHSASNDDPETQAFNPGVADDRNMVLVTDHLYGCTRIAQLCSQVRELIGSAQLCNCVQIGIEVDISVDAAQAYIVY